MNTCGHIIPSNVEGNQKWNGAEPIFSSKVINKIKENIWIFIKIIMVEINKIVEPSAWIKKYFKAASDEYLLFFTEISGIKDNKLSSSPIQAVNHDLAQIDIKSPNNKVIKNK